MGWSSLLGEPQKKNAFHTYNKCKFGSICAPSFRISDCLNSSGMVIRNWETINVTHYMYVPVINKYASFVSFIVSFPLENVGLKPWTEPSFIG